MKVDHDRSVHLPIVLRRLEVAAVRDVTPRTRRITLTGEELQEFERDGGTQPPFRSEGFDDHVKLFFRSPGSLDVVLPGQGEGRLLWPQDGPRPTHRTYTVRRVDLLAGEVDIDIVRHDGGVASTWAQQARVGDTLHIAGPKVSTSLPVDVDVHLLVADETALPAVARYAAEKVGGPRAIAVIEVSGPSEEQDLGSAIEVVWVHRNGQPGPSDLLAIAVRGIDIGGEPTRVFAWVAGEHGSNQLVRRHLVEERGLPVTNLDVTGYWRRGATDDDHDALHDLTDLLTPMAIRVAATLRLADHVADGSTTLSALATASGSDVTALRALVRFLATKRVFALHSNGGPDGRITLGALGELLRDSDHRAELDLASAQGHMEQAWFGLLHTVQTGGPGYPTVFGVGFWDEIGNDNDLAESFDAQMADWGDIWIPHVVSAANLPAEGDVIDVGGGTGRLLAAILDARPSLTGAVVELAPTAARARDHLARFGVRARAIDGSFFYPLPAGASTYVLAQVLHDWPEDDARQILQRCAEAAGPDGSVIVIERVPDDDATMHDHLEMDLLMLNLFASRERTRNDYEKLAADAGLTITEQATTSVGLDVLTLRRAVAP